MGGFVADTWGNLGDKPGWLMGVSRVLCEVNCMGFNHGSPEDFSLVFEPEGGQRSPS